MLATIHDAVSALQFLKGYIGDGQLKFIAMLCCDEEGQWFMDKLCEMRDRIEAMPKSYETDGQGDQAVAHLHYFLGGCDWWITERDIDTDGEGQIQAFGVVNLGYGPELGYINLLEVMEAGAEIDLHFEPA